MHIDRFSDLRILRWHNRISAIMAGEVLGPIRASIDLTNLCNDKCFFCEPLEYREATVRDKRHTLDTAITLGLLNDLREMGTSTINFSGGGEPLLHPDFSAILKFAGGMGFRTWIVTNGRYIGKHLHALAGSASHVRVSLDASNEAEHMEMHGSKPGEFHETLDNIRQLATRKSFGTPEVGISYIVADCNDYTASYERIMQFASDAGVDFIHFRPLSEETPKRFTSEWSEEYAGVATQIIALARNYPRVKVYCVGKRHRDVFTQREFKSCYASLITAVIGANGELQACCDERTKTYGSLYEHSFKELWLSAAHRKMAKEIVPSMCQRCLMCGTNRAVEKYVVNNEALPELI